MIEYTRREFLLGVAGSLGCLTGCERGDELTESDYSNCALSLYQVKSGAVSPYDYIQERQQCLPELVVARKSGMLKDIIYNPSDNELKSLLRESLYSLTDNPQELQAWIRWEIENYKNRTEKKIGTVFPGIIGVFGKKIPLYVAFTEELFDSPLINNDADVRSVVKHELKHVEDWYNGITLNDIHLSYDTISSRKIRLDFLEQLMELRAYYKELEDVFRENIETGGISVSKSWLGSQAGNYNMYWSFLAGYHVSDLERKLRELQFEQFQGIIPEEKGDKLLMKFNLFGGQKTAEFTKQRQ